MILLGLFMALAVQAPVPVVAQSDERDLVCNFPRYEADKLVSMDRIVVYLPKGLTSTNLDGVEFLDPQKILNGSQFETVISDPSGISFYGSKTSNPRMLLFAKARQDKSGYDAGVGAFGTSTPRAGRCWFLGERPKEIFEIWKAHPEKTGRSL